MTLSALCEKSKSILLKNRTPQLYHRRRTRDSRAVPAWTRVDRYVSAELLEAELAALRCEMSVVLTCVGVPYSGRLELYCRDYSSVEVYVIVRNHFLIHVSVKK